MYYVTMQITLPIPEFTRNERNFHCDVLHIIIIYLIIRRCARTGAFPGAFCVPNSVALASLTLQVVNWAIH